MRYYRLITIYYGLARAAPHRVPLQGYGRNYHKRAWRVVLPDQPLPGWIYSPKVGLTNVFVNFCVRNVILLSYSSSVTAFRWAETGRQEEDPR